MAFSTVNIPRITPEPQGNDKELQFNNAGLLDGTAGFEYDSGLIQISQDSGYLLTQTAPQDVTSLLDILSTAALSDTTFTNSLPIVSRWQNTVTMTGGGGIGNTWSGVRESTTIFIDWSGVDNLSSNAFGYIHDQLIINESTARLAFLGTLMNIQDWDINLQSTPSGFFATWKLNSVAQFSVSFTGAVTAAASITTPSGIFDNVTASNSLVTGANGMDVNPGSDVDADLITVGVTGVPRLFWDESQDKFSSTKGWEFSATINPVSNDGAALGTTTLAWSDAMFAAGAVINFAQDVTLTHSTDALTMAGGKLILPATTTSFASLNIPTGTAPTSPVDGDMWNEIQPFMFAAGITAPLTRAAGILTSSRTVANTTTATSLNQAANEGQVTVPANQWRVEKSYLIIATGFYGTTGTPNLTMNLRVGGTVVATTGAQAMGNNVSASLWWGIFQITCRTTGSGGTEFNQGFVTYYSAGVILGGAAFSAHNTGTDALNTTLSRVIDLTVQWGTASGSNTITLTNYFCIEL